MENWSFFLCNGQFSSNKNSGTCSALHSPIIHPRYQGLAQSLFPSLETYSRIGTDLELIKISIISLKLCPFTIAANLVQPLN